MVSIIVLTYNRFSLLSQTIRSILDQTFSDFEIIIVNDGSTDETGRFSSYITDARIKLFNLDKQNNLAKLRNFGIQKSVGEYIAFCDDDDLWIKRKLEIQMPLLMEYEFVCSNAKLIDISNNVVSEQYINFMSSSVLDTKTLLLNNVIMPSSVVFNRKILKDNNSPFDEHKYTNLCEDYNLWIKMSVFAKMYFLDEELILHRTHESWARSFKNSQEIYSNHISLMLPFTGSNDSEIRKTAFLSILNNKIYRIRNLYEHKKYFSSVKYSAALFLSLLRPVNFKTFYLRSESYLRNKRQSDLDRSQ